MLRVAQDELRDADAPGVADRLAEQRVGTLATLGRHEVIGRLEEPIVDLLRLDEVDDIHRPRLFDRCRLEILLRQDDEVALLILVPLDEILPRHGMPITDAHPLEPHRRLVLGVQHPKVRPRVAHRRVQLDRDVDEAERDRSLPQCASHAT
jgi:hypothetical protein